MSTAAAKKLPRDVQRAVRRADKAAREAGLLNAPKDEEEGGKATEQTPPESAPEPQPEPQPQPQEPTEQPPEPPLAAEAGREPAEPRAEPPAELAPVEAPQLDPTDWKAKYSALKGKYDAEIPRMRAEVDGLQSVLASLNDDPRKEPARDAPADPAKPLNLLTEEERRDYGEDFIDVVHRAAQEALKPTLAKLEEENKSLRNQLGGVSQKVAQTQQADVKAVLSREVEDWQIINRDERFHQWLEQKAPYSNQIKGVLLRSAFDRGDAAEVVAFFKGFLAEHAATQPTVEPTLAPTDEPPLEPTAGNGKVDLATLAGPGKGKAVPNANSTPKEGPIWTRAEIAAFYKDVNKGNFKGRDAEKDRYEKDIMRAQEENRIRG